MKGESGAAALPIGVIIPAYNESLVIGDVLKGLPRTIGGRRVIVIVVNDGSRDTTETVVRGFDKVHLINHLLNSGPGAATRTGLNYAKQLGCTAAATLDGDGQHDPQDLVKIVRALLGGKADIVIGSRLADTEGMPRYKTIGNLGLSALTYMIFGAFAIDSQSGLKAFNKKALHLIDFRANDFSFCSEIIWRARQHKLRIREVPVQAIYTEYSLNKGQPKLNGFNLIGQMLKRRLLGLINE